MKCRTIGFTVAAITSVFSVGVIRGNVAYQIQSLSVPSAQFVDVNDINNAGVLTGTASWGDGTKSWIVMQVGMSPVVVNFLPGDTEGNWNSVNSSNVMVGSSGRYPPSPPNTIPGILESHAFVWNFAGGMQALSTPGGWDSGASSINNQGQIVGEISSQNHTVPALQQAVMWDSQGNMTTLGSYQYAKLINNRGQIIVGDQANEYLLTPGSAPVLLKGLSGWDVTTTALTDAGIMVGWSRDTTTYECHAFLTATGTNAIDLTPGTGINSNATAVNDLGQVIGYVYSDNPSPYPDGGFLYEDGHLSNLLSLGGDSALGWSSLAPTAINDHGWIIGTGFFNGQLQSFLMTPRTASAAPEPATLTLLGMGLGGLLAIRRRN